MNGPNDSDPSRPLAGWYEDPSGQPGHRWWDGHEWTTRTSSRAEASEAVQPEKWSERTLREAAEKKAQKRAKKLERRAPSDLQGSKPSTASAAHVPTESVLEVQGHTGTVLFDGDFVTITRAGFLARATVGKGEKRIALTSITAVQWKPAGGMTNGFIQFTLGGGSEVRSRFGTQTVDAANDENSVVFTKKQMPSFEALRQEVEAAILRSHQAAGPNVSPPDVLAQVKQLGELRDAGLLSEEEFSATKAQLLDRL